MSNVSPTHRCPAFELCVTVKIKHLSRKGLEAVQSNVEACGRTLASVPAFPQTQCVAQNNSFPLSLFGMGWGLDGKISEGHSYLNILGCCKDNLGPCGLGLEAQQRSLALVFLILQFLGRKVWLQNLVDELKTKTSFKPSKQTLRLLEN
jgi:hypothetical protein